MEVTLSVLLVLTILYNLVSRYGLKRRLKEADQLLREAGIEVYEKTEKCAEVIKDLELSLVKLQALESNSLTPDNSVPRHVHSDIVTGLTEELSDTQSKLESMTAQFEESRGKQISSRVRLGQISENFSVLHNDFKYNRKETRVILQPIDFVCFEEDEVIFIEVKTGDSQLSTKQRRIRDNIKAGRVKFTVFRFDENGSHWED